MTTRMVSPILLDRLRRHGIVYPLASYRAAHTARLGLPLACAILTQETGGGRNIFGHDTYRHGGVTVKAPGWGWGDVTRSKYLAFAHLRDAAGVSNGVGPCQLTSVGLQRQADAAGGCWVPQHNMAVGFHFMHDLIVRNGLHGGVTAYNGSGAAAVRYADHVIALAEWFKRQGCGTVVGIY